MNVKVPSFGLVKYIWVPVRVQDELPPENEQVGVIYVSPLLAPGLFIAKYSEYNKTWYAPISDSGWQKVEGITHWLKRTEIERKDIIEYELEKQRKENGRK